MLKKAWPGPFTVILPSTSLVAKQLKDRRRDVGVRIPNHEFCLGLIRHYNKPLAVTSLPDNNAQSFQFGYHVEESLGHALDMIIDLGEESSLAETTVIDLSEEVPKLVRAGLGDPRCFDIQE
jgi:tRNA threonylcarbamoyl adenosine modification protein (Sua5/YciO/YrdC/YwlC family)